MYLIMNDKSFIGTRGGEIEKGNLKYLEIPDVLLEDFDFSFIENFKTILRANGFRNIKHRKREPKLENKLDFFTWVKKDRSSIPFFDYSIWDKDMEKITYYFNIGELIYKELEFLDYLEENKKKIIKDIKKINLSLSEYYFIAIPFSRDLNIKNMFIQKDFLIETLNNYYKEYPNRKDYEEIVISKIKLLSDYSQIFLSYISHTIMYFDYSIDEDVFDSLDDTLVYNCSISDNVSSCFTIMFPLLQTSFKSVKL